MRHSIPTLILIFLSSLNLSSQCLIGIDSNNSDFYGYDFSTESYTDLRLNAGPFTFDTYLSITEGITDDEVYVGYLKDSGFGSFDPIIIKYNLTSNSSTEVISEDIEEPIDIAIDASTRKFYWIDKELNHLASADLDGANPEVLGSVTDFLTGWNPVLAIDEINQVIYFSQGGRSVFSTSIDNWDPLEIPTTFSESASRVGDIVIDEASQFLYWSNNTPDSNPHIVRVNLSTMEETKLVEVPSNEFVFRLSLLQDRIYWTGQNSVLYSSNLDGMDVRTEFDAEPFIADFVLLGKGTPPPPPPPMDMSIQGRLNRAQSGDTVWVEPGIYFENIIWPEIDGIVLKSIEGSDQTIIDGAGVGRVITMRTDEEGVITASTVIDGFTLQNGDLLERFRYHGGLKVTNANPTLKNLVVTDNEKGGAALACYHGTIENCRFDNNKGILGGGMWLQVGGDVSIINSSFSGNVLTTDSLDNGILTGGGLSIDFCFSDYSLSTVSMSNCTISDNSISAPARFGWGGGIYMEALDSGLLIIDSSIICNNRVTTTELADGGGIIATDIEIYNSDINNNRANTGAGLYVIDFQTGLPLPTIIDGCIFSENEISNPDSIENHSIIELSNMKDVRMSNCQINLNVGKAIQVNNDSRLPPAQLELVHNTIVFNSKRSSFRNTNVNIVNSIFWNDGTSEIESDSLGQLSISHSIIRGGIEGEIIITEEPMFHTGMQMKLKNDSPGVGQGVFLDSITIDLEGKSRPIPLNSNPDIGAYEIDQSVTSTSDLNHDKIHIYPNPVNHTLTVSKRVDFLHIYDINGIKLISNNNTNNIDLSLLSNGIYMLEIVDRSQSLTKKIIKK